MPTIVKAAKPMGMPEGTYNVKFVNLKLGIETQFGMKQGWEFEVLGPPEYAGRKLQRLTGLETGNEKALCTQYMKWVTGDTESKDVEPFYGSEYQAVVSLNDKGYNTIERIFPSKKSTSRVKPDKVFTTGKDTGFSGVEVLDVISGIK